MARTTTRPTPRLTPKQRRALLDQLRAGKSVKAAAPAAGISHTTLERRMRADPKLKAAVDAARQEGAEVREPHEKFDAGLRDRYLEQLREGLGLAEAARALGIAPSTAVARRQRDPAFAEACRQASTESYEKVENALYKAAISGNVTAIIYFLQNRLPDKWQDKRNNRLALTGPSGEGPVQVEGADQAKRLLADYFGIEPDKVVDELARRRRLRRGLPATGKTPIPPDPPARPDAPAADGTPADAPGEGS